MIRDQTIVNNIVEKFYNEQLTSTPESVINNSKKTSDIKKDSLSENILQVYNTETEQLLQEKLDTNEYFVYKGDDYFNHSINNYKSLKINIIFYTIYVHNHIPFVMFLMYKYPKVSQDYNELITFPHFISTKEIEKEVEEKERLIFKNYDQKKQFKYIKENDEIYVLCEQESKGADLNLNRDSSWWWCLPFELVNLKKILGFTVDEKVVNFLLRYDKLMYVYTSSNDIYESPCIGYKVTDDNEMNYQIEIGGNISNDDFLISYEGVYDYIRNFIENKKAILIRYVVFLFKTKIVYTEMKELKYKNFFSYIINDLKTNFSKLYVLNDFQLLTLSNHVIIKDEIDTEENII
jgi:hypothetical protein